MNRKPLTNEKGEAAGQSPFFLTYVLFYIVEDRLEWCSVMRKVTAILLLLILVLLPAGCSADKPIAQIAATTAPVYGFVSRLCQGTDLRTAQLVSENVSCLHDYTLQTSQMRLIENADLVILSGAGLEQFMDDVITDIGTVVDASAGVPLLCSEAQHDHGHEAHDHSNDPHIWLSPSNAGIMVKNICDALSAQYPQHRNVFERNLTALLDELTQLDNYAQQALSGLRCRQIITFHDGFAYFADAYDLEILKAVEEESGSEASALELVQIIDLVRENRLNCIFTEINGSTTAAHIIAAETGANIFPLDMAMGEADYFTAMYHNIDTLKEALE